MSKIPTLLILVLLLTSCQKNASKSDAVATTKIFTPLESQENKAAFLQEVLDTDQNVRIKSREVSEKYGIDSKEHLAFVKTNIDVDDVNLSKISWYLENYDYPDEKTYGKTISITPALVVHHSLDKNVRRTFYPKFKSAYDNGLLAADFFALYLGRIYELEKGNYYKMKSPYQIEDQIDSLIVKLKLED